MSIRCEINEYLAAEFGLDDVVATEAAPFVLEDAGSIAGRMYFRFTHAATQYYAWGGRETGCYPVAGMSLTDLALERVGAAWIAKRDPLDLATSMIGHNEVPTTLDRKRAIQDLASRAGLADARILEGLFLRQDRSYLCLVEADAHVAALHTSGVATTVALPGAAIWRRLAWAVGTMLSEGKLPSESLR